MRLIKNRHCLKDQTGQTLIETIVAIFVLTTALATGIGLGIFAFTTSTTSQSEIIASNLAREGIDVIRMMRDSNWLAGDASGGSYALATCGTDYSGKSCYPLVNTGPTYNFTPFGPESNSADHRGYRVIQFNSTSKTWSLQAGSNNYNLYLQADGTYSSTVNGTSVFARKINLTDYFPSNPGEFVVRSIVGWTGKNCTVMTNQDPETTNCKIIVEEHLTNWKDYQ